ncbi:hypothetical protein HTZ77_28085 [Nonomuraea sp. SMC257]|uniref:BRCT domain-containing protein n=1 Tax=Nonomuraea montanisoli TaxID=2741721 RepID=A0A7Y6IBM7_9ACTN|nr:hypothetical protein [Nonomuraea montanisoli]NUW35264.1 hypothetical protein [Nonomuraea montanisoli]
MDLRGKTFVLAGGFRGQPAAKVKMRLRRAGANVVDEVSPLVDAVFERDDVYPNERVSEAERLGVPVLPGEELQALLALRRRRPGASGSFPGPAALEAVRDAPRGSPMSPPAAPRARPWPWPWWPPRVPAAQAGPGDGHRRRARVVTGAASGSTAAPPPERAVPFSRNQETG